MFILYEKTEAILNNSKTFGGGFLFINYRDSLVNAEPFPVNREIQLPKSLSN